MATNITRLGPYELLEDIGRGGMAVVFLARDERSGRQVALKQVPQGNDAETQEILEAEQRGAELQEQFCQASRYVPIVYDYGLDAGFFYVAMEYIDGENLSKLILRGPVPVERAVAIALDLCEFLEQAHTFEPTSLAGPAGPDGTVGEVKRRRTLIHGDLTSTNVRITSTGQVKVLDFGIAKTLSLTRKMTRNDYGSLAYLSPERLDSTEVDPHSDFWAVGVLLFEMVRGAKPFIAPDPRRLEQLILSRRPAPSLDGRCPIGLQAIIAKLLAPAASDRYENAAAIREDLHRFASGLTPAAEQDGWPNRDSAEPVTRRTSPWSASALGASAGQAGLSGQAGQAGQAGRAEDEEPTRRTRKPEGTSARPLATAAPPVTPVAPAAATAARGVPRERGRLRRYLGAGILILVIFVGVHDWLVATSANRVEGVVRTRELDGLSDVWAQYESLTRRSYLGMSTDSLRQQLVVQTTRLTDRVIENYLMPTPTVRETQWKMAREALAHAVAAQPSNRRLQAAMRYCDGHLHRINGEARMSRNQTVPAQHEFTEAVTAFREAAELRANWPDPFLGLARTFIYGLQDVDRGSDALKQAQDRGYAWGERETVQLADGYRLRAETMFKSARQLRGMPQEREYLARAAEAYEQAHGLYGKVVGFADVPRNLTKVQRGLEDIQKRMLELTPASQQFGHSNQSNLVNPSNPSNPSNRLWA